jgi:hypothetical protein
MFGANMGSGFGSALVDFLGLYRLQASCVFQHLRMSSLEPPAKITTAADVHRDHRPLPTCYIEALASPEKVDDGTFGVSVAVSNHLDRPWRTFFLLPPGTSMRAHQLAICCPTLVAHIARCKIFAFSSHPTA